MPPRSMAATKKMNGDGTPPPSIRASKLPLRSQHRIHVVLAVGVAIILFMALRRKPATVIAVAQLRPISLGLSKLNRTEESMKAAAAATSSVKGGGSGVVVKIPSSPSRPSSPRPGGTPPKPFRIVILTQHRHRSLSRLLVSIEATDFGPFDNEGSRAWLSPHLEIHVDGVSDSWSAHKVEDRNRTIEVASSFEFRNGTKDVQIRKTAGGLRSAWFEAWKPGSDDERAVILEDDMELSPLWYRWLTRAWDSYGDRDDVGGISLCRQRLRASDGEIVMMQHQGGPFLYRVPGSFGFSPNARHWGPFMRWTRYTDLDSAIVDVKGTVTTNWHRASPDSWEQFWIWWCWGKNSYQPKDGGGGLYTLYVHSRVGALIAHWAEPGVHATLPANRNDTPLKATEAVLEMFPKELDRYGWDYRLDG